MDKRKFEDHEIEEYLRVNAEYSITTIVKDNIAVTLTYGDILNYIYDLECNLAGADMRIDELEELVSKQKREIGCHIADQEVYISGYQGTQKENDSLKLEITQLTNSLDNLTEEYRLCKNANETIKENAAELQKQVDELRKSISIFEHIQIADTPTLSDKFVPVGHNDPVGEKGACGLANACGYVHQAVKDTANKVVNIIEEEYYKDEDWFICRVKDRIEIECGVETRDV